jgi:Septum formation initiator.
MYSLKTRTGEIHKSAPNELPVRPAARAHVSPGCQALPGRQELQERHQRSSARYRVRPFALPMGPVTLTICSILLIGLMAVLYISQQAQAVSANQQLQSMRNEQNQLTRQNQDLTDQIATEQSPAHIAAQATHMGLVPADPAHVQVIKIHNLQPITSDEP